MWPRVSGFRDRRVCRDRSRPRIRPAGLLLEARLLLAGDGLLGSYYDTIDFSGPPLVRVDPTIDFNWGSGSPDPAIGPDTFSVRWTGQVQAGETGTHQFFVTSDDGVRFWLDGVPLVDSWYDRAPATDVASLSLTAGRRYDLLMEYYENGGGAVARLEWSGPGFSRVVVPQENLFSEPEPGDRPPYRPVVKKPRSDGDLVNYSSVLFETLAFVDPNPGDEHAATDWLIVDPATEQVVWQALGVTDETLRVRIAVGDGEWLGELAERQQLAPDHTYRLRVRYQSTGGDEATRWSDYADRLFVTSSVVVPPPEAPVWRVMQPGYVVETVATGFQLPVNIAFVPQPAESPESPFYYVTELYGSIKVVTRGGVVSDYATGLLNFNPSGDFPGSGEMGVTGLLVDPATGDLYASMLYFENGQLHPKVDRFRSFDGGLTADVQETIFAVPNEPMGPSHQISNLSIGPDGKLYVHMGDGFNAATARNLDSFRGKILRMELDGRPVADNPFYDLSDGINSRDYIVALGVRNPFGGAWRTSDGAHYSVENGPSIDRMFKLEFGKDYRYDGSDGSMLFGAIYNWIPAAAPVNIAFIQEATFGGSQFPAEMLERAFVSESGPTWATGPVPGTKEISIFDIGPDGTLRSGPQTLVRYEGTGKGTVVALAAGPDGLYFSDFYKDDSFDNPIARGSNILRVRYVGIVDFAADVTTADEPPLTVRFTDRSTVEGASAWFWDFGDGSTSTEQNPEHTYTQEGIFDVTLSVTGARGSIERTKRGLIRVGRVVLDFSQGFGNPQGLTLNGNAQVTTAGRLRLTDDQLFQTGSLFSSVPVDVTRFRSDFTFQIDSATLPMADGLTFVVQSLGPEAIGETGGGLGYAGLTSSVGIKFDLYNNAGEGVNSTGLVRDGEYPSFNATTIDLTGSGIDLNSGRPHFVSIEYDGAALQVTISDTVTGAWASQVYEVSIPQHLGGTEGFVGFTGATGGLTAVHEVLNWTYHPTAPAGLTAPTGLTAVAVSPTSVRLTWIDNASTETAYLILRKGEEAFGYEEIAMLAPNTIEYLDEGLEEGRTFSYRVVALNDAGQSGFSNTAIVTLRQAPPSPSNVRVVVATDTRITLGWWDLADNEDGYRIYRLNNRGSYDLIAVLPADSTQYSDLGLAPLTSYIYAVQAFNAGGGSEFVGASATTLARFQPLPRGWETTDIGAPPFAGFAGYRTEGRTFVVGGSGADIWDSNDQFHFVYQPYKGNFQIVARVGSLDQTDPFAKAGLMIRSSLDPAAAHAFALVTPAAGVRFQRRVEFGGGSLDTPAPGSAAGSWLKLTRIGDSFTAYVSADGGTWTLLGTELITMSTTVYAGLAVTSHNLEAVATATFEHVGLGTATSSGSLGINAGGSQAERFQPDAAFEGGETFSVSEPIDTRRVPRPAPQEVYQTQRTGNFTYIAPNLAPGQRYSIRLHFAELSATGRGARKFNVQVNGREVLRDFDVFAAAGGPLRAVSRAFLATADADGRVRIEFTQGSSGLPILSGIEVTATRVPPRAVVTSSGLSYNRYSELYVGTVKVTNNGPASLNGPLFVVFRDLTPEVELVNASGFTDQGEPYLAIDLGSLGFLRSKWVGVRFRNPRNLIIRYQAEVVASVATG